MSELKIRHQKWPEDKEPLIISERFISDYELQYMDEHNADALHEEYRERFGKNFISLRDYEGSVEKYMAELQATFEGEDIDAIVKKHPKPEPMSVEEILELLKHRKGVE